MVCTVYPVCTMQSEQCACIKSPIHVFNLENWLFSIVVSLKKVTSKFLLQENDDGNMRIKHFSIQRNDDFWSGKGITGPAVDLAFTSLPGGWLETTFFIEKPLIKVVNFLRKKYGNLGYFCSHMVYMVLHVDLTVLSIFQTAVTFDHNLTHYT